MTQSQFFESESGRYIINATEEVVAHNDLSWSDVFEAIDETEELWRQTLFDALTTPFNEVCADVMSGVQVNNGHSLSTDFTFRVFDQYGSQKKFKFLRRSSIFLNWFREAGLLPQKLTAKGLPHTRFPKGFDSVSAICELGNSEVEDMLRSVLLDPATRQPVDHSAFNSALTYHTENIRRRARAVVNLKDPLTFLNAMFDGTLSAEGKFERNSQQREERLSDLRFLALLAAGGKIALPAKRIAAKTSAVQNLFPPILKGFFLRHLAGARSQEIQAAMRYLAVAHKGQRQVRVADFLIWFCSANYGKFSDFAPEFLQLVQVATAGEKNNVRPYLSAILEFHDADKVEAKRWDNLLAGRNSKGFAKTPFDLFTMQPELARSVMPVQVRNYEEKTGFPFPNGFDEVILDWVATLKGLISQLPRNNLYQVNQSAVSWVTYLTTLPLDDQPKNFKEVERNTHIEGNTGYKRFLENAELEVRVRLRDIHQIMRIWARDEPDSPVLPIKPETDWTNREKTFRTKRKAIPQIVVETLLEENARECDQNRPYALYRNYARTRGYGSTLSYGGKRPEEEIPSVAAVIDCILHLGMRSSSARFLDSGEADEYSVDLDTVKETPNTSQLAKEGVQNGFLQRMQVGPNEWVPSFLMLRNKTIDVHEVPYAPKALIRRLQFILDRQRTWNPIQEPVYAVEKDEETQNLEDVQLIYPLFRNPDNLQNKPVSYVRVTNWWRELLKHCEPIVHRKRQEIIGKDCEKISFFDVSGSPMWDIHSIRVTVVTALLDMGVSPTIVQHLVGHKSPIMTLHYEAVNAGKISRTITQALEERRLAASEAIGNARTEEELDDVLETVLGGVASEMSGSDYKLPSQGAFATGSRIKDGTGAFSVFSHGVCPGGDCAQGGEKKGPFYLGVHRDKACSRCRFRITGPAFLAGLELNANILMSEIAESTRKEKALNKELLELNKAGKPAAWLESRLAHERDFRDELWADWAAEASTIRECILMQTGKVKNLPALPEEISISFEEKGRLSMFQDLIEKSGAITGSIADLPIGYEEIRDRMLWDIAAECNVAKHLIQLPKAQRDRALNDFGSLVCDQADFHGVEPEEIAEYLSETKVIEQLFGDEILLQVEAAE